MDAVQAEPQLPPVQTVPDVATYFITPGALDLSAITVFGMNAKPNTDTPIGYFGTGLKYAIATLVRNGIPVTIYTGGKAYVFYTRDKKFRYKTFQCIMMKQTQLHVDRNDIVSRLIDKVTSRWKYTQLPFTTQLGKNWELWQAYRELYSNTLDENGETMTSSEALEVSGKNLTLIADGTVIAVEGSLFAAEHEERAKTFLVTDATPLIEMPNVIQIFNKPSKRVYYRGIRVLDTKQECLFTYNILRPIDLTEDRTAKYLFQVTEAIGRAVIQSDKPDFIHKMLLAPKDTFEKEISYAFLSSPGEVFLREAARLRHNKAMSSSAYGLYETYAPRPPFPSTATLAEKLIHEIEAKAWDSFLDLVKESPLATIRLLEDGAKRSNDPVGQDASPRPSADAGTQADDGGIPF